MNDDCEKYFDLIEELIEGELEESVAARVNTHVFACADCRDEYELLKREKDALAQYLFETEQPPNSWANFEARLISENVKASEKEFTAASWLRRRQRIFGFNFSPPATALAALIFVCGIGFVWLQIGPFEKRGDEYVAELKTENSPLPTQSNEFDEKPAMNSPLQTVADDDIPRRNDLIAEGKPLKAKSNSLFGKKSSAETAKNNQKPTPKNAARKSPSDSRTNEEQRLPILPAQNLEIEIAGQMEKVELLLRSFRNARWGETTEGFDVEYEKKQARKLLDANVQLKCGAENYGLSYAEELLNLVEPHLLEIANLETKPSPDKVLGIKERVSSQNIIASLQAYSRDVTQ